MVESSNQVKTALEPITSFKVLVCRVAWCFAGPVLLAFLALKIAVTHDGWIAASDIAFPIIVAGTVAARWICFGAGDRSNTMGQVTTIEELRRYSIAFSIVSVLAWITANVVGNFARQ